MLRSDNVLLNEYYYYYYYYYKLLLMPLLMLHVQRLSETQVIAVIQGGYDVSERLRSAAETVQRPVAGTLLLFLL